MRATITLAAPSDTSTVRMSVLLGRLGPFQSLWKAWSEANDELREKEFEHFEHVFGHQLTELKNHHNAGQRDAAVQEAIDIISVALNYMRWMDLSPREIAKKTRIRAKTRMQGKTLEILAKYKKIYDV